MGQGTELLKTKEFLACHTFHKPKHITCSTIGSLLLRTCSSQSPTSPTTGTLTPKGAAKNMRLTNAQWRKRWEEVSGQLSHKGQEGSMIIPFLQMLLRVGRISF